MDWDAKATLNRLLEHLTPAGKVDWKAVMAPDIATKIMGERGRKCLALQADGPEMTACRNMLAEAKAANQALKKAPKAPLPYRP